MGTQICLAKLHYREPVSVADMMTKLQFITRNELLINGVWLFALLIQSAAPDLQVQSLWTPFERASLARLVVSEVCAN